LKCDSKSAKPVLPLIIEVALQLDFVDRWLIHFGIPLGHHPSRPVYFIGEGRLFFDNIDSVDNNYNFWGGIRIHFKQR